MLDKVLIAEDHESANLSIQRTVEDMKITHVDHVYYCDAALEKIRLAKARGAAYDLLISDLQFEDDGQVQTIADGFELIKAARDVQPELRILIFSAESRPVVIDKLFRQYEIDAFVRKARNDAKELKAALQAIKEGRTYSPPGLARQLRDLNTYEFKEFDIRIIRLLAEGYQQNAIPDYLKRRNITPSSLSSIEKRLSQIREEFGFTKNEQLVLFCKEAGIL